MVEVIGNGGMRVPSCGERLPVRSIDSRFSAVDDTAGMTPDGWLDGEGRDEESTSSIDRKWRERPASRENSMVAPDAAGADIAPQHEDLQGGMSGRTRSDDALAGQVARGNEEGVVDERPDCDGAAARRSVAAGNGVTRTASSRHAADSDPLSDTGLLADESMQFETFEQRESRTLKTKDVRAGARPSGEDGEGTSSVVERGRHADEQRRREPVPRRTPQPAEQSAMPDFGDSVQAPREFVYRFESWGAGHAVRIVQDARESDKFTLIPSSGFVTEQLGRRRLTLRKLNIQGHMASASDARTAASHDPRAAMEETGEPQ
ncbi:hypothetical protein [Burkholderia lata]|uniref:SpaN/EivJ family type III secretion system needle length determinant n=1 Tax=Burkholderia lata (strain ATCC 17760 / DSM 23089 / LMG 22485 / NCIMB 9086 / R18194 / 383) TaxID=482957 RepID=UPI00399C357E